MSSPEEHRGYRVRGLRLYGSGEGELLTDPSSTRLRLPGYPVIREILERRARGEHVPSRLGYRLGVLCLKKLKGRHPLFSDCSSCPLASDCAYPRDPEWFKKKGIV